MGCVYRSSEKDSESSSEEEQESLEMQLQRVRHAVRLTREIMGHIPEAKASIRQVSLLNVALSWDFNTHTICCR